MNLTYSFRDTGSPLHRFNASVWLTWTGTAVVASLVLEHPLLLVSVLVATVAIPVAAAVVDGWWRVMRFAVWMFLMVVVINAVVSNEGSHVLWAAGFRLPLIGEPRLTLEAIAFGAAMGIRLVAIISAFTILNLCVHPDDLMRSAIKARLPYRSVLVTSLSTRFIPVLLADANTIMDVQRSRGVNFSAGGLSGRVRNYGALVLPLLSNSLDRAVQVAEAMESRGFGASGKRTFFRDKPLQHPDVLAIVALVGAIALAVVTRVQGVDTFAYYPTVSALSFSVPLVICAGLLLALLLSPIPLSRFIGGRNGD